MITVDGEAEEARRQAETELSFQLYRDLRSDKAVLHSLPDLALRIRRAIEDEASDARRVARLIEADPAMAAKLLKAANSAMYGGLAAVESCPAAVVRLGMQTTKNPVLSFALKDIFQTKVPMIQQRMQALWKHSSQLAALCFVLAGARDAENWLRQHPGPADFTDLLIVAQVHERLRKQQLAGLPELDKLSALQRVLGDDLTPERSLEIMHQAKQQADEMRSVLRS